MKELDSQDLYELPFHDSDFLGANIVQRDNGETDLLLVIGLDKGELTDLSKDYLDIVQVDGSVSLLLQNCERINISCISKRSQRDEIDYIQVLPGTSEVARTQKHVEVMFVSGSRIDCLVNTMILVRP